MDSAGGARGSWAPTRRMAGGVLVAFGCVGVGFAILATLIVFSSVSDPAATLTVALVFGVPPVTVIAVGLRLRRRVDRGGRHASASAALGWSSAPSAEPTSRATFSPPQEHDDLRARELSGALRGCDEDGTVAIVPASSIAALSCRLQVESAPGSRVRVRPYLSLPELPDSGLFAGGGEDGLTRPERRRAEALRQIGWDGNGGSTWSSFQVPWELDPSDLDAVGQLARRVADAFAVAGVASAAKWNVASTRDDPRVVRSAFVGPRQRWVDGADDHDFAVRIARLASLRGGWIDIRSTHGDSTLVRMQVRRSSDGVVIDAADAGADAADVRADAIALPRPPHSWKQRWVLAPSRVDARAIRSAIDDALSEISAIPAPGSLSIRLVEELSPIDHAGDDGCLQSLGWILGAPAGLIAAVISGVFPLDELRRAVDDAARGEFAAVLVLGALAFTAMLPALWLSERLARRADRFRWRFDTIANIEFIATLLATAVLFALFLAVRDRWLPILVVIWGPVAVGMGWETLSVVRGRSRRTRGER